MQILHDFLKSDALLVMQFVTMLGLVVFGLLFAAQMTSRQRKLHRDNMDLRDEVSSMAERRDQAVSRLLDEQSRHRMLLSKIGDDIYDVQSLTPQDFDCVRPIDRARPLKVSRDIEEGMIPLPSNDPSFAEEEVIVDPALRNPVRASVTDISRQHQDLEGPVDDSIDEDSDPLTRALKISKAIGRQ